MYSGQELELAKTIADDLCGEIERINISRWCLRVGQHTPNLGQGNWFEGIIIGMHNKIDIRIWVDYGYVVKAVLCNSGEAISNTYQSEIANPNLYKEIMKFVKKYKHRVSK